VWSVRGAAQALVDGYTAAFYNAFFTALPIGIFSVVDRPFRHLNTFMRFPQVKICICRF